MEEFNTPLEAQLEEFLASQHGDGEVGPMFTGGLDDFLSSIVSNVGRMGDAALIPVVGGTDTAGGLGIWQNLTGHTLLVDSGRIVVNAASTGACTVSVGLNAAVVPPAVLVPAIATQMFSGQTVAGAGAFVSTTAFIVPPGAYVVASTASGASAGLRGLLLFDFVVIG